MPVCFMSVSIFISYETDSCLDLFEQQTGNVSENSGMAFVNSFLFLLFFFFLVFLSLIFF